MYDFENFVQSINSLSEQEFLKKFLKPLLIIEKKEDIKNAPNNFTLQTHQVTNTSDYSGFMGLKNGMVPQNRCIVFDFNEILKNQYYVGRTNNNEITLKDSSVSKIHAFFKKESKSEGFFRKKRTEQWFIQDTGSDNGTIVNGAFIAAQKPHIMEKSTGIQFGPVYFCTFFYPPECYTYAKSLAYKFCAQD